MCHHQISQGIEDDAIMYAHYSSQEYNQGDTKILSNGCSPTKSCSHQTVAAGSSYTNSPHLLSPQTDAKGCSHLLGNSQGSGAVPQLRHSPISQGSSSVDSAVLFTTKPSLLAHQFYSVSPKSGNSKLVSGSKESL